MVSKLSSDEVLSFLILVSTILITARILGEIFRKFKQPAVIGEILAGVILGPSLLGTLFPHLFQTIFTSQNGVPYKAFDGLAQIGIILFMFIAGFEVDLKMIRKQGKQAASKIPSVKVLKMPVSPKKMHLTIAMTKAITKKAIHTTFKAMTPLP